MKLSSVTSINVTENLIAKRIWNTMKNHPTSVNTLKTHNVCLDQENIFKHESQAKIAELVSIISH